MKKFKILCLHGHGSNNQITEAQIRNIFVNYLNNKAQTQHQAFFDSIVFEYLEGPIEETTIAQQEFVERSAYSTNRTQEDFEHSTLAHYFDDDGGGDDNDAKPIKSYSWLKLPFSRESPDGMCLYSFLKAIEYLLDYIERYGPYDAVYGFSQAAALITALSDRDLLQYIYKSEEQLNSRFMNNDMPFKAVILCCAAGLEYYEMVRKYYYTLSSETTSLEENNGVLSPSAHLIGLKDEQFKATSEAFVDIFGRNRSNIVMTCYLNNGHEVSADACRNENTNNKNSKPLEEDCLTSPERTVADDILEFLGGVCFMDDSDLSSLEKINSEANQDDDDSTFLEQIVDGNNGIHNANVQRKGMFQLAKAMCDNEIVLENDSLLDDFQVYLNTPSLPLSTKFSNLLQLLASHCGSDPVLYSSDRVKCDPSLVRDISNSSNTGGRYQSHSITYSEIVHFIRNEGCLEAVFESIGFADDSECKEPLDERVPIVAYLCPSGLVSAVAFLTITSQCTAVPLNPLATSQELFLTLSNLYTYDKNSEMHGVDLVLLFGDLDDGCITAALDRFRTLKQPSPPLLRVSMTSKGFFSYNIETTCSKQEHINKRVSLNPSSTSIALILQTSGTTSSKTQSLNGSSGRVKLIPITNSNLLTNANSLSLQSLSLTAKDVSLNAMPLFHIGGIQTNLLSSIMVGGACICVDEFRVDEFVEILTNGIQMGEHAFSVKPTWYSGVPTQHLMTYNYLSEGSESDRLRFVSSHNLKFIRSGAAHLSPELAGNLQSIFQCPIISSYSMSEQMPIASIPFTSQVYDWVTSKPGSVGKSVNCSICIVDPSNLQPLPANKISDGCSTTVLQQSESLWGSLVSNFSARSKEEESFASIRSIQSAFSFKSDIESKNPKQSDLLSKTCETKAPKPRYVGEICISGPTVFQGYLDYPEENKNSFFRISRTKYFRTGDVGYMDSEGFLFITGRLKELIKKGGEQIEPNELEDNIMQFRKSCVTGKLLRSCIVFGIPDKTWGNKVGAVVLIQSNEQKTEETESLCKQEKELSKLLERNEREFRERFRVSLREYLVNVRQLHETKMPDEIIILSSLDDVSKCLPKTSSGKYIRKRIPYALKEKGLLMFDDDIEVDLHDDDSSVHIDKAAYEPAINGLRFILAVAVCYVHIGNFDNWSISTDGRYGQDESLGWGHTRSLCFHTPLFFFVGGFVLASATHDDVSKSRKSLLQFYSFRLFALHPMYLLSILLCLFNWVCRCKPNNYVPDFEINRMPLPGKYFTCQATPSEMGYFPTLISSIVIYFLGLQSWPLSIHLSWFISSYTWFSSVYIFCIILFPWCNSSYLKLFKRNNIKGVWKLCMKWLMVLYGYMGITSLYYIISPTDPKLKNFYALMIYLFPPGWLPCFVLGIGVSYLLRFYKPAESSRAFLYGVVSDFISLFLLLAFTFYGLNTDKPLFSSFKSIPDHINSSLDQRFWDFLISRLLAHPIGILWFLGIALGKGITAKLLSHPILVNYLASASYNMFLFHQPISEWYFLATRRKFWAYPKDFYWFSPYPVPVEVWEFPIVLLLVIIFSVFMENYVNSHLISIFSTLWRSLTGLKPMSNQSSDANPETVIEEILLNMSHHGRSPLHGDATLDEVGMSSMSTVVFLNEINNVYKDRGIRLSLRDINSSKKLTDLAAIVQDRLVSEENNSVLRRARAALNNSLHSGQVSTMIDSLSTSLHGKIKNSLRKSSGLEKVKRGRSFSDLMASTVPESISTQRQLILSAMASNDEFEFNEGTESDWDSTSISISPELLCFEENKIDDQKHLDASKLVVG